jgi:hypothetical protein
MATERGSLGFGQRLVLLCAWLVSCGFVYVLGVYVGKGMHDRGPVSPGVSLPVDAAVPPAPAPDAQAPLTFYDVLGTQQGGAPAPRPTQAAPAARAPQPDGTMTEQKLASATPPPAAPSPATPAPAAPAATPAAAPVKPASPVAAPAPAKPVATSPASPVADTNPALAAAKPPLPASKPTTSPPPTVPAMPAPSVGSSPAAIPPSTPVVHAATTPPPAPPAAAGLPPQTASGRWTVYANPSRDELAVEHERAALHAKGYPAEVVTLRRDGDTWYRIRVGRYATEAQAEEASRKLRTDGVGHAFVQSE